MILLDANIFMYAAGAAHSHKAASATLLERVADGQVDAGVDAEVLQEILHRYRAIGRWREGRRVYDLVRRIVPSVVPITAEIVDGARALLDEHSSLGARDALHVAACRATTAEGICSYDKDLDRVAGLRRWEPHELL